MLALTGDSAARELQSSSIKLSRRGKKQVRLSLSISGHEGATAELLDGKSWKPRRHVL